MDGRRLRSERSRSRLIEASLSFVEKEGRFPTAAELADHSGIAHRSIFRLFTDLDEIRGAAIEARAEIELPLYVSPDTALSLDDRIEQVAKTRVGVHEKITPIRSVTTRYAEANEALSEIAKSSNTALRNQLADLFADSLATLSAADRRVALNTVDLALSWETYHRLRVGQGLSKNAAQQLIVGIVTAALPRVKGRKRK